MNKYKLQLTAQFIRKYKKITNKNALLIEVVKTKLYKLANDPFQASLKTHKYMSYFSSSISGDLRIIWKFTAPSEITLYNFGGHDGRNRVYK